MQQPLALQVRRERVTGFNTSTAQETRQHKPSKISDDMPMTMMMMVFGCQLQLVVEVARVMQSAAAVALQPRTIIIMPPTVSIDSRLECGSDGAVALGIERQIIN